ncbi:MAG: PrsW family glutamic-type intramembrane protease [Verrucomicrobiales bacterium]|nr:PrsW family glutamic-type intramembrane protease [Verrucomicrobiales bacterium]
MVEAVFIGTFVPMILMLGLLRHSRAVISCFCWGMVSFLVVHLVSSPLYAVLGITGGLEQTAVFVGPPLEELIKPIPVFLMAMFAKRSFVPFFYILGLASGIGFAVEENLIYLIKFDSGVGEDSRALMVIRSFSTCLMHGVATGLTGYALTMAQRRRMPGRILLPLLGLILASFYHAAFNWMMLNGHLAVAVLVAFACFIAFLLVMKEKETKAPEAKGTAWE